MKRKKSRREVLDVFETVPFSKYHYRPTRAWDVSCQPEESPYMTDGFMALIKAHTANPLPRMVVRDTGPAPHPTNESIEKMLRGVSGAKGYELARLNVVVDRLGKLGTGPATIKLFGANGGNPVTLDADKVKLIQRAVPGAVFFANFNNPAGPVAISCKGEFVGAVMPRA